MPGHQRTIERTIEFHVFAKGIGLVGRHQEIAGTRGRHRFAEGRIERRKILFRHFCEARGQFHVDLCRCRDLAEIRTVFHGFEFNTIAARGQDNVLDGNQLGHVVARFRRQAQAEKVRGQAFACVFLDGAGHTALAAVVRGEREFPGIEHAVEFLQVIQRRVGGQQHIAAIVGHPVLLQAKILAGAWNELPHSRCLGARIGLRVESAFDDRQQRDFGRHAATFDFFDHMVEILRAAIDETLNVFRAVRIPLFMVLHQRCVQLAHDETAADALPEIGIADWFGWQQFRSDDFRCRFDHANRRRMCARRNVRSGHCVGDRDGAPGCSGTPHRSHNDIQAFVEVHPESICF